MKFRLILGVFWLAATGCNSQPLDIKDDAYQVIPADHAQILSAFETTQDQDDAETLIKAARLLDRMGARPAQGHINYAEVWTQKAIQISENIEVIFPPDRGRVKGPAYRESHLSPGESHTIEEVFFAGEPGFLTLKPRDGALSISVVEAGNPKVCDQPKSLQISTCQWTPSFTAPFSITITNHDVSPAHYFLISN